MIGRILRSSLAVSAMELSSLQSRSGMSARSRQYTEVASQRCITRFLCRRNAIQRIGVYFQMNLEGLENRMLFNFGLTR